MKEQTPITAEEWYKTSQYKGEKYGNFIEIDKNDLTDLMEQYAKAKVLEAQNELIQNIKEKVAKLEETTTITDLPFDLIHLLKSIEPIKK